MRLPLFLLFMFAATLANATDFDPPSRYIHDFNGELKIERYTQPFVYSQCAHMYEKAGHSIDLAIIDASAIVGCSVLETPTRCRIIMIVEPHRGSTPRDVFLHELGHCNGWPSDHSRQ